MTDVRGASLDDPTYERFRALVLERSGLHFAEKRRLDLERGLREALAQSGQEDWEGYFRLLQGSPTNGPLWEHLIAQVTVGETYFFRDRGQFEALRQHVLPGIIARRRPLARQLRIWSAGCASGEEPYSLAILLREMLPDIEDWSLTILATDINRDSLERARAGRYGDWSFREEGWEGLRARYFTRRDKVWEIDDSVRRMVTWSYLNLVEDSYPSLTNNTVAFDLILCRNVTMYFTPELIRQVVGRLYEALVDEGWLVVGASELSPTTYTRFQAHTFPGAILYQKGGSPMRYDLSWLAAAERVPAPAPVQPAPPAPGAFAPAAVPRPDSRAVERKAPPAAAAPPQKGPVPDPCAEALAALERGQSQEALEHLRQLLEKEPRCARGYLLVARIRANAGLWDEARRWCERALELDPLLTEAHFLLALVHSQEGQAEEALAAMKRVVYLERDAALGHYCLANLYRERGDAARARKSLTNAAHLLEKLSPETPIPWSDGMTAGRLLLAVQRQMGEMGVRAGSARPARENSIS